MRNLRSSAWIKSSVLLLGLISGRAHASAWDAGSNPFIIGPRFETDFNLLPLRAELPKDMLPWSGSYWSNRHGSIAYRWQSGEEPKRSSLKSLDQLKLMTAAEIALLSPAEKIDIVRGQFDYPTVQLARSYAREYRKAWEGLCAGWSQSSLNYVDPRPASITKNGISVWFGSGDLKALAAFYYELIAVSESPENSYDDRMTAQIGRRCHSSASPENCGEDLNPGALHIVLTNRIGFESAGLIADFDKGSEVWQHPIHGFTAEILGERSPHSAAAALTRREVQVRLTLAYATYSAATAEPSPLRVNSRRLEYWLELDSADKIIGGSYSSGSNKLLDYAWVSGELHFSRGYEILNELLTPRSRQFTIPASPGG